MSSPFLLSSAVLAILFGLVVLGAVALGSLFIWLIVVAWRHITTAPGQSDEERLDELEERIDALEAAQSDTSKVAKTSLQ